MKEMKIKDNLINTVKNRVPVLIYYFLLFRSRNLYCILLQKVFETDGFVLNWKQSERVNNFNSV